MTSCPAVLWRSMFLVLKITTLNWIWKGIWVFRHCQIVFPRETRSTCKAKSSSVSALFLVVQSIELKANKIFLLFSWKHPFLILVLLNFPLPVKWTIQTWEPWELASWYLCPRPVSFAVGPDTLYLQFYPFNLSFSIWRVTGDFPWLFYNQNKQIYSRSGLTDSSVKKKSVFW